MSSHSLIQLWPAFSFSYSGGKEREKGGKLPRKSGEKSPEKNSSAELFPYEKKCDGRLQKWAMKQYHANKKNHETRCAICNDHCKQEEKLNAGLEVGVGSLVSMRFNDFGWQSGTITKFNAETKDYTVIFLDGVSSRETLETTMPISTKVVTKTCGGLRNRNSGRAVSLQYLGQTPN